MIIELVYVTVTYSCGCVKARPVQPPRLSREIYANHKCDFHSEQAQREEDRRAALLQEKEATVTTVRYMVDGEPMNIVQDQQGYWRGKRYEHSKKIQKYFGKSDPRPLLEEALS